VTLSSMRVSSNQYVISCSALDWPSASGRSLFGVVLMVEIALPLSATTAVAAAATTTLMRVSAAKRAAPMVAQSVRTRAQGRRTAADGQEPRRVRREAR
jgi:hypothetical protein